jgi:hypothetical protein
MKMGTIGMFLKNLNSETYICRRCGKLEVIDFGPHGMAFRAIYGIPAEWIHISLKKDEGIFCSKKCARKWLKNNA